MREYTIGRSASLSKQFSEEDVNIFARLSLDTNPVHLDEEYAKDSVFGNKIVHGFLVGSLISAVIGTEMPGPGSIYLHQEMNFKKPVYLNEVVTAKVTITDIKIEKSIIYLETICSKQNNEVVIEGKAVIKLT